MIKTAVFQKDDGWWFRWWNVAEGEAIILKDGKPWNVAGNALAQNLEGPFGAKEEAEHARDKFVEARRQKYPLERVE